MYLLGAPGGLNTGEIILQLIAFLSVFAIPLGIIIVVVIFRKRNTRLKRIEEKLDKLIADKDKGKL